MTSNTNCLNRDSRTLTKFTNEQEEKMIHANPDVTEKQKIMQNLTVKCIQNYESILKADRRQFTIHRLYKKTFNEHIAKKKYQRKEALKGLRTKFFESNCFESVEQSASLDSELLFNTYTLPKRERLATLLFAKANTKQALHEQRLSATDNMHAFCKSIEFMPKSISHKFSKARFSKNPKKIKYSLRC